MNAKDYIIQLGKIALSSQITSENIDGKIFSYSDGIEAMCSMVSELSKRNAKLLFIGNGGSAGISSHCAIDFWRNGRIPAMCFNDGALLTCISNDFGYEEVFAKPIEMFATEGDLLIAISSSGSSENILNGAKMASSKGCGVITLSGFSEDNPLRRLGDLNLFVPSVSYGYVELAHQIALHTVLDLILEEKISGSTL